MSNYSEPMGEKNNKNKKKKKFVSKNARGGAVLRMGGE